MTSATGLFSRGARALGALTVALACAVSIGARAEDIDIFEPFTPPGTDPNILIILDNSSNWSSTIGSNTCNANLTKFDMEMCALSDLIGSLNINARIGLMLINEKNDPLGGYIRYAVRDMGTSSTTRTKNRDAFANMLKNFVRQGTGTDATGSSQPAGWLAHEAWMYFFGKTIDETTPGNGGGWTIDTTAKNGAKRRDWNGNGNPGQTGATDVRSAQVYGADAKAAFSSQASRTYISPITNACQKNIIIYIANGNPGGEPTNPSIADKLASIGGDKTIIKNTAGNELHPSYFDEYARFLWDKKSVHTYGIAVWAPTPGSTPDNPIAGTDDEKMRQLLMSAANVGNGKFFDARDASAFRKALADILNEIQAVNSVFVSASLPVSVNTQGTYLNQVYMGMFRPDRSPRWLGNLKEYKILQNATTGALYLADATNTATVNPNTGFISPTAQSFWTADSTFWTKKASGAGGKSDLPDGDIVEKGGAAEQQRTAYLKLQDTRNMFTCPMNSDCALGPLSVKFDTATVTGVEAQFGVSTSTQLKAMVNWIRGQDNVNGTPCDNTVSPCTWTSTATESGPGWPTTVRPSIHGDVLHSRPVVLNYKSGGPHIFYGAGDGTLRGAKGGRLASDGNELWSFIAPEFYGQFKRLRDASPEVKFPTSVIVDPSNPPLPKTYFFDGAIGSYQSPDLAKAYIFATPRRGGRFIYGFDVSTPASPSVLWKLSPKDADFKELGQAWSEPKAFMVKASTDPVIMFGAGYDTTEDSNPAGSAGMGRGVYVVNAVSGKLLRFFQTSDDGFKITSPVPSDVAVIDHDFDTYADRAYVGDMAGNVWRMDIDDKDPALWKMYKFAQLGPDRKFFFRPDIVISKSYDLVLIGSGNREDPTNVNTKDNFYMLKDPQTGKDGSGQTPILVTDLGAPGTDITALKGWKRDLALGEKVVNAPLSIGGIVYFSTNRPTPLAIDPNTCSPNLGEARAYALDFLTGLSGRVKGSNEPDDVSVKLTGGGLPPSPVGGVVQLDDGKLVDFIIGSGAGGSAIAPEKPKRDIPKIRKKLYWNTNTDK